MTKSGRPIKFFDATCQVMSGEEGLIKWRLPRRADRRQIRNDVQVCREGSRVDKSDWRIEPAEDEMHQNSS
uniref:Transposase n=1 Tax=Steinernema glaseri TaxID=37863 RepID=A0A1I7YTE7_9BILA